MTSEAFRHCVDCEKPLPRHGNSPARRCRKCNAREQGRRRFEKVGVGV